MKFKNERFVKPRKDAHNMPTRHLYFAGIGHQLGTDLIVLKEFLQTLIMNAELSIDDIYAPDDRRFLFVTFPDLESSSTVYEYFQNNSNIPPLDAHSLVVKYAESADDVNSQKVQNQLECITASDHIQVKGLYLVENFITAEEEEALMDEFGGESAPWKQSLSRRVQHYGFPFSYKTLMIDYTKPTPPLTLSCKNLAEKITNYINTDNVIKSDFGVSNSEEADPILSSESINQLTINEYLPGQGIAPHIDTETCFGPIIAVLNICGDIVMNLARAQEDASVSVKKQVFLPRRSLLILSQDARYLWSHAINPRKFDNIHGEMVRRSRRLSLTFRQVNMPKPLTSQLLHASALEAEHVVKVYDAIAVHWNHTRGKRKVHWSKVKDFLDGLCAGSLIADIGSGDGKYFNLIPGTFTIGCDRSLSLLEVSREPSHETFCCDAVKLPFLSSCFDAVICVAVLHHLASVERRFALIAELVRIAAVNARIFIQAWALEQDISDLQTAENTQNEQVSEQTTTVDTPKPKGNSAKHVFKEQDTFVPWRLNKRFVRDNSANSSEETATQSKGKHKKDQNRKGRGKMEGENVVEQQDIEAKTSDGKKSNSPEQDEVIVYERYCHVYKAGELEELCSRVPQCQVVASGWDKGNWFVELIKIEDARLSHAAKSHENTTGQSCGIPTRVPRKEV